MIAINYLARRYNVYRKAQSERPVGLACGSKNNRRHGTIPQSEGIMQTYAKRNTSPGPFWAVRHIGLLALLLVVMLGMTTSTGNAQSTSGTILGTVTDSTGAVMGNTTIQLINSATGTKT